MFKHYPVHVSMLFAPLYEEIIFRGLILGGLLTIYSTITAVVVSSLLFGLWHLKNIFYLSKRELIYQILYTIGFGAVMAYTVLLTGSIWLAVILHYLNNIVHPYLQRILK